jgi:hypothetical protein
MSDGYIGDTALRAPDLVEAVVGVRGFARSGHSLASPFQGDEWRRPEQRASCSPDRSRTAAALAGLGTKPKQAQSVAARIVSHQQRLRKHAAPDNECACGLYAYHEPDAAHLDLHPIVGVVEAWGALCVHATGFRAARVKVVALALRDDLDPAAVADQRSIEVARRALAWWKVPLLCFDELVASYREFGSPVPEQLRPNDYEGDER